EGIGEVASEVPAVGVDGASSDADEDEQPLTRSAVAESSATPPRVSFRRRIRVDDAVALCGW
ncbi:hypothetical protein, partial [Streptomyces tricolor]|uniref:hypothetical protein n=1 Tax=Streptomyces tricolor TaxID=68277 RepID=UPI001ABF7214